MFGRAAWLSFHLQRLLFVAEQRPLLAVTLGNSVIDDLAIIRSVCRHRRNVDIDLIREDWQFRNVADIRCQFHRDNLMRIGIDSKMKLAPTPARADAVFLVRDFRVLA